MGATESKPGLALIFSHKEYDREKTKLSTRDGNEADVMALKENLNHLGFSVRICQDYRVAQVYSAIRELVRNDVTACSCLVVVVLTHGGPGGVLWAFDGPYHTKDVWEPFVHCEALRNKPKIFIFQACRGLNEEPRVALNSVPGIDSISLKEMFVPKVPHRPDFLLIHSTVEDNVSKRDHKSGTVFISSLCVKLDHAIKEKPMDLLTLLTRVHNDVANRYPQTATFTSFLHSSITVGSLKRNQASTSQSTQLSNDGEGNLRTEYPRSGKIVTCILYTNQFQDHAERMKTVLKNLPRSENEIRLFKNIDHEHWNNELDAVSKCEGSNYSKADTLLFMLICCQHSESSSESSNRHCEKLCVKTIKGLVSIQSIWSKFTAEQCPWLLGKPKLFFFCEPYCTDAGVCEEEIPMIFTETVTNQSDFLRAYCYGNEIYENLLEALKNSKQEITEMLTTLMRESEQKVARNEGRFSHFESTLTLSAYLSCEKHVLLSETDEVFSIRHSSEHLAMSRLDVTAVDDTQRIYSADGAPEKTRFYTNIASLVFFVVFLCGWVCIAVIAFNTGDPQRLRFPVDYLGQRCGFDENVRDKPLVFYFNITACASPDTVRAECPSTQKCMATCPNSDHLHFNKITLDGLFAKDVICRYGVIEKQTKFTSLTQQSLIYDEYCAHQYWSSTPLLKHCLPTNLLNGSVYNSSSDLWMRINKDEHFGKHIFDAIANLIAHAKIEEYYEDLLQDLSDSWHFILIGLLESVVLSFVYLYFLRRISVPMVWINVGGIVTALSYGIYVCYERWQIQDSCSISRFLSPRVTGVCDRSVESYFLMAQIWFTFLIVCFVFILVVSLIMFLWRSKVSIAIKLIKETGKAMSKIKFIHFFPTVPWLLHLAFAAFSISVWLFLLSSRISEYRITDNTNACNCSSYKSNETCDVEIFNIECDSASKLGDCKSMKCSFYSFYNLPGVGMLHAYNIIGAVWSLFFIFAFQDMVLAGSFAEWIKEGTNRSRSILPVTLLRTVRYHVGTLALGSVLNSVCGCLRLIPDCMNHQLRHRPSNVFVRQIRGHCISSSRALGRFLFFLNHAFILCAIHSCNLQKSSEHITKLKKNRHGVDKCPYFLLFLAKLLLTLIAMVQWSLIFSYRDLKYHMFPVITVGLGTYFIASLFFRVYSTAIDTLFILYLEDSERNDGSEDKPYRMPSELRELFQNMEV